MATTVHRRSPSVGMFVKVWRFSHFASRMRDCLSDENFACNWPISGHKDSWVLGIHLIICGRCCYSRYKPYRALSPHSTIYAKPDRLATIPFKLQYDEPVNNASVANRPAISFGADNARILQGAMPVHCVT